MYIRQIKSRKSTCFQIGEKRYGKFVLVKHVGCALLPVEIEALRIKAKAELSQLVFKNQLSLLPETQPLSKAKLLAWYITGSCQLGFLLPASLKKHSQSTPKVWPYQA